MASKTPLPLNKEDEVGRKWDRCLTDLILKLGKKCYLITNTCLICSDYFEFENLFVNIAFQSLQNVFKINVKFDPVDKIGWICMQ